MQLDRLTLSGFTRFPNPVTLDLLEIPEGSLVAIVGDNGEGKTTLLDSVLAPVYLTMPSRRGHLFTYATSADAWLEATYRVRDMLVRCRVNVDGPRRETRAVLEVSHANGQRNVSSGSGVTAYREDVGHIFPPLELALASAFAAQNRAGSFVTATAAQRKDLFAVCLGLEQFAEWAETAKAAVALVDKVRARLDGQAQVLEGLVSPTRLATLQEDVERASSLVLERRGALEEIRERQAELERQRVEHQGDLEAYHRAQAAYATAQEAARAAAAAGGALLQERDARLQEVSQASGRTVAAFEAELREIARIVDGAQRDRDTKIRALENRIAANESLRRQADTVRTAAAAKKAAELELERLRAAQAGYQAELDDQAKGLEADLLNLGPLETAETKLEAARLQVGLVEHVPCKGRRIAVYAVDELEGDESSVLVDASTCQFLKDAKAAGQTIAELEDRVLALPTARRARDARQAVIAGLRQTLGITKREIESQETIVRETRAAAELEPQLAATEERIAGYQREIEAAQETFTQAKVGLDDRVERSKVTHLAEVERLDGQRRELLREFEEREAEAQVAVRATDFKLHEAAAELERRAGAAQAMDRTILNLKVVGDQVAVVAGELAAAEAGLRHRQTDRLEAAANRVELERVRLALESADQERAVWETLRRCFDKNGLPTLEIGNSGPTVSSLTNELLEVAYGPRFTVEVVTQVEKAGGKGIREDFTIRIIDNQEGGAVRDIGDLSGGERVLVEEALRAAIMVFVNGRQVTPIRTICRDETTGALDPENAVRYVAMLRRLVALSGAAHCLFITHNPECAELADVVLEVRDGQVERRPAA